MKVKGHLHFHLHLNPLNLLIKKSRNKTANNNMRMQQYTDIIIKFESNKW